MSTGMPELGSKISLISKADIRYEGRLFTVDPTECTIALASVRSFGTEDRETQFPVAPQTQVYDYILFRGTDIKDIRVLNNVPSLPNDPAIMQMSVPPTLGSGPPPGQYSGQYNHPIVGQSAYPQYHPMGFPGGVHSQLNKTSELSPQTSVDLTSQPPPTTAPIGSGVIHHANQVKDQGAVLDFIGASGHQNASRSTTPAVCPRKSPTADQGTQVGSGAGGSGHQQRESRRGSGGAPAGGKGAATARNRVPSRTRLRQPSGGAQPAQPAPHTPHMPQPQLQHQTGQQNNAQPHHHHQPGQGYNRGGWRGRGRGRGRGFVTRNGKNTLKFDKDYDFELANTEFEELRSQLAKVKIADAAEVKLEGEVDKKDDSGNETGAGEPEVDEDPNAYTGYDKTKSFFDNISCEAVERSKGRSQRTDWRTERKLNSETFGVALARRGAWRGRSSWRPMNMQYQQWRPMRGGGRGRGGPLQQPASGPRQQRAHQPASLQQPAPAAAQAK